MAPYRVARAYEEDVTQIAYMSAKFMTADPLLNIMLRDASGVSSDSLRSRTDVALHRYTKALTDSIEPIASSLVLVSFHCSTPRAFEASVLLQSFYPDPYWHVPWKDQPGTFDIPPNCVNTNIYYTVENALHTNRKLFMQGKAHYCASLKHPHRMVNTNKASKTYNNLISVFSVIPNRETQAKKRLNTCSRISARSTLMWTNTRTSVLHIMAYFKIRAGNTSAT